MLDIEGEQRLLLQPLLSPHEETEPREVGESPRSRCQVTAKRRRRPAAF